MSPKYVSRRRHFLARWEIDVLPEYTVAHANGTGVAGVLTDSAGFRNDVPRLVLVAIGMIRFHADPYARQGRNSARVLPGPWVTPCQESQR